MSLSGQHRAEQIRTQVLMVAMASALLLLVWRLFSVQIIRSGEYETELSEQSMRLVRLPGVRGRVFDRYGQVLCDNRPSYNICIYIEELRKPGRWFKTVDTVDTLIDSLASELSLPRELDREQIVAHAKRRLPLPLEAWRDVSEEVVARFMESSVPRPGVDVQVVPRRVYPRGQTAAHILGYVGSVKDAPERDSAEYDFYLPELIGRSGIEKRFNSELSGVAGGALLRVDVMGFKHEQVVGRKPIAGNDIHLTLDAEIQRVVEEVLAGRRGAGVVIDPRNGDILAMASSPTYDLGLFTPRISSSDWARLRDSRDKPLLNRAVSEHYPPGSIFKPVVAIAALQNEMVAPSAIYGCPGYYQLGSAKFRCWRRSGHGELAMRKAIEQSCNSYFCQIGLSVGHEAIAHMGHAMGLGSRTGVELDGEAPGLMPTPEWKQRKLGDGWRAGDTCNLSIGQGFLVATPLQMASMTATIANGGVVYRPRLILEQGRPPALINRLNLLPETQDVVLGGMRDVIQSPTGTGRSARIFGVEMGGKTGTAEYGPRGRRKKHAWMIVFAPFENPRYAMAMVIEDGQGGGSTVGFRVKRVMETVFQLEAVRGEVSDV